jgi:hypothetical protein
MRIDNNRGIALAGNFRRESKSLTGREAKGTSLVPLASSVPQDGYQPRPARTLATFVTQLIAKSQDAPHLRERRRADPAEAADAYRKMMNLSGVPNRYKARPF